MVSLYKTEKTSLRNDADYISCELRGLSTDEKPTEINGKTIEISPLSLMVILSDVAFLSHKEGILLSLASFISYLIL